MNGDIQAYNNAQTETDSAICNTLATAISAQLKTAEENLESKIWHAHPVWFLNENPIVGYSKEKKGLRLMFWSGADFEEAGLAVLGAKFKDASIFYKDVADINVEDLKRWLQKSMAIQWDYKNIVKRKGQLLRLK